MGVKDYLILILKPFNITNFKVDVAVLFAFVTSALSFLTGMAEDHLGVSGAFFAMFAILITADFVTGILAALISEGLKGLSSSKGLKIVWKSGAYVLFIYVSYSLYKEIRGEGDLFEIVLKYFHIFLISHITFWELFSVDENLKKMGVDLGITELLKSTYRGVKSIFENITKQKIRSPESEMLDDEEKTRIRNYDE